MILLRAGRRGVVAEAAVQVLGADEQVADEQGDCRRKQRDAQQRIETRHYTGIGVAAHFRE